MVGLLTPSGGPGGDYHHCP